MITIRCAQIGQATHLREKGFTVVDVTVKSGVEMFAPTWDMVMRFKKGTLSEKKYTALYATIMDYRRREYKMWLAEHDGETVYLVCYCPNHSFCHRHLLRDYLTDLADEIGMEVGGPGYETAPETTPKKEPPIDSFRDEHRFLSNFWFAEVTLDGITYPGNEWAFVAYKSLDKNDRREAASIKKPGEVKRFGRTLNLRPDWMDVCLDIMEEINFQKYARHPDLREKLLATGNRELIEGNTWGDTFWGVCGGTGHNHLGKILMRIREALR